MPWDNPPSNFAKDVRKRHSKIVREAAGRMLRGVILKSPVDTGRFRANWQISAGKLASNTVDSTQPDIGAQMANMRGGSNLIFVVNNLPYAEALENGHSGQAPQGMVALTMLEVTNWLRRK